MEVKANDPVEKIECEEAAGEDDHEHLVNVGELVSCVPGTSWRRFAGFGCGFWGCWSQLDRGTGWGQSWILIRGRTWIVVNFTFGTFKIYKVRGQLAFLIAKRLND